MTTLFTHAWSSLRGKSMQLLPVSAHRCSATAQPPRRALLSQVVLSVFLGVVLDLVPGGLSVCPRLPVPHGLGKPLGAAEPQMDFNRDIRPILSENCFYCHGQDGNQRQADLRLDVRDAAVEAGAIVPGSLADSQLIERIRTSDPELKMPPASSNRHLTDEQIALLEQWVANGAQYATHWAFQPLSRPEPPAVEQRDWGRTPVDAFVLAKIESAGLQPAPEADRATLIKRLYADLLGLPPDPAEVERFVVSREPDAYERLVEQLLASPRYGERMALPWLDAARYADSNGFQQDGDTWQWVWRDWVVEALNEDLPFDDFTVWQLAGDLLPEATVKQKVASGFNRNHLLNGEGGAIAEEQRFVILFDRIDTTSTVWLGLTMACAQCHDHKYDPLTMRDYYSLMDAFNRVPESGVPQRFSARIRVAPPLVELPTEENNARIADMNARIAAVQAEADRLADAAFAGWREGVLAGSLESDGRGLPEALLAILRKAADQRSEEESKSLAEGLRKHFSEKVRPALSAQIPQFSELDNRRRELAEYQADQIPRVMIMSDAQPRETAILDRGEYLKPTEKVAFATPAFLPPLPPEAPRNRLGLAQWLVSDEQPLTARVHVNRVWQHFFGAGIVKTAEDFGVQSEYPLHLDLLNWLAAELRERDWSVKSLHRMILLSSTYRQSSKLTPQLLALDPENRLLARGSRFRMPSLVLRDWALSAAGLLERRIAGAPVYPYQPDDVWEALAITKERDFTYPQSRAQDLYRRSLYTFWRRTVAPANMFDASNRQTCRVRTSVTSTPLHALTTLNDPSWVEAARVLAERVLLGSGERMEQIEAAFRLVLCRPPRPDERLRLQGAWEKQLVIFGNDPAAAEELASIGATPASAALPRTELAAMTSICLAILNLDEALSRQ
jgi:hypothetical protein